MKWCGSLADRSAIDSCYAAAEIDGAGMGPESAEGPDPPSGGSGPGKLGSRELHCGGGESGTQIGEDILDSLDTHRQAHQSRRDT